MYPSLGRFLINELRNKSSPGKILWVYQSVDREDGFGVVENVAEGTRVSIDQFQSECLLKAPIESLLTINSNRISRLIVNGTVGWRRRLAFIQR